MLPGEYARRPSIPCPGRSDPAAHLAAPAGWRALRRRPRPHAADSATDRLAAPGVSATGCPGPPRTSRTMELLPARRPGRRIPPEVARVRRRPEPSGRTQGRNGVARAAAEGRLL